LFFYFYEGEITVYTFSGTHWPLDVWRHLRTLTWPITHWPDIVTIFIRPWNRVFRAKRHLWYRSPLLHVRPVRSATGRSTQASRRRRLRRSLRAQAEASMPASWNHFTILLKFLTQHFTTTSGSLQLCSKIIYNILIVPIFIQTNFKCVSGVSKNNPVRQKLCRSTTEADGQWCGSFVIKWNKCCNNLAGYYTINHLLCIRCMVSYTFYRLLVWHSVSTPRCFFLF